LLAILQVIIYFYFNLKPLTGTMKDVALTYLGFVFFDNVHISVSVMVGLLISFIGAT
jgi:hypothetical protein